MSMRLPDDYRAMSVAVRIERNACAKGFTLYAGPYYHCPVCESSVEAFLPHGEHVRARGRCQVCRANARALHCCCYSRRPASLMANPNGCFTTLSRKPWYTDRQNCRTSNTSPRTWSRRRRCCRWTSLTSSCGDEYFDVTYCSKGG